jgi:hypothetical protein
MKTKRFFLFGLSAVLLALGLVLAASLTLAGCGGDDGDGGGGGLDLPGIDEETTGRSSISGTNISVTGTGMPQALETKTGSYGETFSITGGKLSFTLSASPSGAQAFASNSGLQWKLFGNGDSDYTVNPTNALFATVSGFYWNDGNVGYEISRAAYKTDYATYQIISEIIYVYADKDVTLSRAAKNWTQEYGGQTSNYQWGAVNLALKTGWNLVQIDSDATGNENNFTEKVTVKIADKNVPWMFEKYESSSGGGDGEDTPPG